jgi:ABC-type hemin transport system ATPase subunit
MIGIMHDAALLSRLSDVLVHMAAGQVTSIEAAPTQGAIAS